MIPIIAVTGGVASGKSEVTRRFEHRGVPVFDADIAAREAVAPGSPGLAAVIETFGTTMLSADGSLDRRRMRERVFSDPSARSQLEAIIHPQVRERLHAQVLAADRSGAANYALLAIPLLTESGGKAAWPFIDRILVVDTQEALQIARLTARDGIDANLARSMLAAQSGRAARLAIADDVIVNDGDLAGLDAQVETLHRRYSALSGRTPHD